MSENTTVAASGKYLTFGLAEQEYGLPVLKVREIIKIMDITAVPRAPSHIKGVINLRGKVIPIIDLRLKFELRAADYTERTCIIVVDVELETRRIMLGIIVDAVSEVLNVAQDEIEAPPTSASASTRPTCRAWPRSRAPSRLCSTSIGSWRWMPVWSWPHSVSRGGHRRSERDAHRLRARSPRHAREADRIRHAGDPPEKRTPHHHGGRPRPETARRRRSIGPSRSLTGRDTSPPRIAALPRQKRRGGTDVSAASSCLDRVGSRRRGAP